jgi:hypothetical protein
MSITRSLLAGCASAVLGIALTTAFCQSPKQENSSAVDKRDQANSLIRKAVQRFAVKDYAGILLFSMRPQR